MSIKFMGQTISGPPGKDATINGENALTIQAGGNAQLTQAGSTITISAKLAAVPVILTASGWTEGSQTVRVAGVSADEAAQLIQPVPALASQSACYEAGILCAGQAADSLTFTADTVPTADLTLYVVIQEVAA